MGESRAQAYMALISKLLECLSGEEPGILQTHQDLLDQGFVTVVLSVAKQASDQGEENTTQFLVNLAQQVAGAIELEKAGQEELNTSQDPRGTQQLLKGLLEKALERLQAQGYTQRSTQQYAEALETYTLLLELSQQLQDQSSEYGALYDLGCIYGDQQQHQQAIEKFTQALTLATSLEDENRKANTHYMLGKSHEALSQVPQAIKHYQQAAILYAQQENHYWQNQTLVNLATLCQSEKLYVQAIDAQQQRLALAQQLQDQSSEYGALYKLGDIYDDQQQHQQAIEKFTQALTLATSLEDENRKANTHYMLGKSHEALSQVSQAIKHYQKAEALYLAGGNKKFADYSNKNLESLKWKALVGSDAFQTRLEFFMEVLDTIVKHPKDTAQAYSLLESKTIYLDDTLLQFLPQILQGFIAVEYKEARVAIAEVVLAFSNLIQDFPLGNQGLNRNLAITACDAALEVYTRQSHAENWAIAQNSRALAYRSRIKGDRAQNLEEAIAGFDAALEVCTRQSHAENWAKIQNNRALAYIDRIKGDRAQNLEEAIAGFDAALEVHTQKNFPVEWALVQHNRANAYSDRIKGDHTENLEKAIADYDAALKVRQRSRFPENWADTYNSRALAYSNRIKGSRAQNLEKAIAGYDAALEVHTQKSFPMKWAAIQNNRALAYSNRIKGSRAENLEIAIKGYRTALEVYSPDALPFSALLTGYNLGNCAYTQGWWKIAIEGYKIAITAVEQSRHWALTDDRKQEILEQSLEVYEKMIYACIQSGRLDLALQTVERSRSKRLVELMSTHDLYADGNLPDDIRPILEQLEAVQQEIDQHRRPESSSPDRELTGATRQSRVALQSESEQIQQLEAQKQAYLHQLNAKDPVSAGLKEVQVPDLKTLQSLVQTPGTALLSFYTTDDDTHIFILKASSLHHFVCTGQGFNILQSWLIDVWVNPYILSDRSTWKAQMPDTLVELAQRLQLSALLQQDYMGDVQELILTPHLFLHQIPFNALPLAANQTLGDVYQIRYTPSCQVLQFCEQREPVNLEILGIVENATQDLPFSSYECEQIAQLFGVADHHRLRGRTHATPSNYRALLGQVQGLVSSHHAQSRIDNPLESALMLADGSRVTLGQLLSPSWRFPDLGDVFLSCCETGLSFSVKSTEQGLNIRRTDDIFTLATGFLCAGARSVISTLWSVDDLATALFSTFYHHYRKAGKNRVTALRQAQNDLRSLSGQALQQDYAKPIQSLLDQQLHTANQHRSAARRQQNQADEQYWTKIQNRLENAIRCLEQQWERDRPFDHPVYWSGFVVQGIR